MNLAVIVHGPAEDVDLVRFISISATRQKKGFLHRGNCQITKDKIIRLDKKYHEKTRSFHQCKISIGATAQSIIIGHIHVHV